MGAKLRIFFEILCIHHLINIVTNGTKREKGTFEAGDVVVSFTKFAGNP